MSKMSKIKGSVKQRIDGTKKSDNIRNNKNKERKSVMELPSKCENTAEFDLPVWDLELSPQYPAITVVHGNVLDDDCSPCYCWVQRPATLLMLGRLPMLTDHLGTHWGRNRPHFGSCFSTQPALNQKPHQSAGYFLFRVGSLLHAVVSVSPPKWHPFRCNLRWNVTKNKQTRQRKGPTPLLPNQ